MLIRLRLAALLGLTLALALGCGDDGDGDGGTGADGGGGGIDGGGSADGGTGMDAGAPTDGGVVILDDGAILLPDGAVIPGGGPATCQGRLYQCGDTIDNDGDGLVDAVDPDCLGPCDNNETGFNLGIPGGDSARCRLDCYFDQDQGSGNDQCNWDHRCDPLEPDSNPACAYQEPPWTGPINCPDEQDEECGDFCRPLVPNGCDCFGCCNLPAGGDRWVFIGSVDEDGTPTCNVEDQDDDGACHPCTPVDNCLNDCGECELCLGRTELPPSCFPTPPGDAGTLPDGGLPDLCGDGRQTCGIPGAPACPDGFFCLTGCCTFFG